MIGGNAILDVSPANGSTTAVGNSTSQTYVFYVENTGTANTTATFSISSCAGAVSNCSLSPSSASVPHGGSVPVTVTFHTAVTGSGTIMLTANWGGSNYIDGSVTVTLPSATPSVAVGANPNYSAESFQTNDPNFTVTNSGNTASYYSFMVTQCSGNVSNCSVATPNSSISPGSSRPDTVSYTTGPFQNGNGTIALQVTSLLTGEVSSGTVTIVPLSPAVAVTPDTGTATANPNTSPVATFVVSDTGNSSPVTYNLTCGYSGTVTGCSVQSSVQVYHGSPQNVSVTYTTSGSPAGGAGTVTVSATPSGWQAHNYADQGSYNISVASEQAATTPAPAGPAYDDVNATVTRAFAIHNPNAFPENYMWSATCANAASCSGQSGAVYVPASSTVSQNVTYTAVTSPSNGTITFSASDAAGSSSAVLTVVLNTYAPGVVPSSGGSGSLVTGQQVVDTFVVRNQGNQEANYSLSATCDGAIPQQNCLLANSTQAQQGVDLLPNETVSVPVRWSATGTPVTSHVSLTASFTDLHATPWTNTGTRTLTYFPWVAPSITANGPPSGGFAPDAVGLVQSFMVTNNGSTSATYDYHASCVDAVGEAAVPTSCAVVQPAPYTVTAGENATVQVSFNSGDEGTSSTMTLVATEGTDSTSGPATIAINQLPPTVTTATPSVADYSDVPVTRSFMIHNPNAVGESYSWTLACHGVASCTTSSGWAAVAARDSASIGEQYTPSGAPNATGTMVATASSLSVSATDSIVIRIKSYTPQVTAVGSPDTLAAGVVDTAHFTVKNIGLDSMAYVFTASCDNTAAITCVQPPSTPVPLLPSQQTTVAVRFTAGANFTSGGVMLHVYPNGSGIYADSATFAIIVRTPGSLTVNTDFMNSDNQDMNACAASCFAAQYTLSTAPFYTLNTPRTTSLVYNSDRVSPRPFIYADVSPNTQAGPVQQYLLQVRKNGVNLPFTNGDDTLFFAGSSVPIRLTGQVDMSSYDTDLYPVDVMVTAVYGGGGSETVTSHTHLLVVNESHSPVARGWTLVGPQHIYERDSVAIITDGTGSAEVFAKCGTYCYQAPTGDFSTLAVIDSSAGAPRTWIRTYPDGTQLYFGVTGDDWMTYDHVGRSAYIGHDTQSRVTELDDPGLTKSWGSYATSVGYDANGISWIREPSQQAWRGRMLTFRIGTDSLLYAAYTADSDSTVFTYDSQRRLTTVRDMNGAVTTYTYDSVTGKVVQVTGAAVPTDAGGGSTTLQQPTVVFTPWQSVGVPRVHTSSSTPATAVEASAVVAKVQDPAGAVTQFTVDRWGQPLITTDAMGNVTTIKRSGMVATEVDESQGRKSLYTYEGPNLTISQPAGDSATHYHYGLKSQVDSIWGKSVVPEARGFNSDGTVAWVRQAGDSSRTTHYTYDPTTVQVATITDPLGHTTVLQYDATFGNLARTTAPSGQVISATFDRYGRDSTSSAPGLATTTTLYDIVNRPVSVNDGAYTTPTTFTYDPLGRFSVVTDPMGQSFRTEYDTVGRVTRRYDATGLGKYNSYRYDIAGRTTSSTNRRGQRVDITYDLLGRMLTRTDITAGNVDRFSYSADGLTSGSANANAGDTTDVDVMNATSQTTTWENGVRYSNGQTLNPSFNVPDTSTVTALTFGGTPSQRITGRDPLLGALGSVSLGGHTVTFGYDHQLGVRMSTTYVPPTRTTDGSVRADSYAPFTALPVETSFSVAQVDSVLHRAYGYDSAGRLTSEQVAINYFNDGDGARQRQRQFSYDSLGRLTNVTVRRGTCMPWPSDSTASDSLSSSFGWRYTCGTVAPDSGAVFSYDSVGNRTDHSAIITAGDRLASFNGDTITYDDDGNMIRRYNPVTGADHRYVWNALGQLDSAIVVSAIDPISGQRTTVTEHYVYDAGGRLVHVDGSPNTGWLVYQGDQVSEVVQSQSAYTDVAYDDGTDRPAMEYIHTLPSDEWRAEVIDPMGNLAGTVNLDSIGVPHTWDAWGKNTSTTWDGMDAQGWKGLQPETGTGLIYMRARWYDPALGRFISEDPAGLAGGINPYVFAGDDPINKSDPAGLYSCAGVTINATDCGDPLQMPGGAGYGAILFSLSSGPTGGDVNYAGAPIAHGLIIVDRSIRDALATYRVEHPDVDTYLKVLESSQSLFAIADADQHAFGSGIVLRGGVTFGGPGVDGRSEQDFVDQYGGVLGLTGLRGLSLISSVWASANNVPIAVIAAHEAIHLWGLDINGIKPGHHDRLFQNDVGCRVYLNCAGQP